MCQSPGSRDVLVNVPPRISEIAGLNADAPLPPLAVGAGVGSGGAAAQRRIGGCRVDGLQLLDARFERIDARAVFTLHCLQFGTQRRDVVGGGDAIAGIVASAISAATGLKIFMEFSCGKQRSRGRAGAGVKLNGVSSGDRGWCA